MGSGLMHIIKAFCLPVRQLFSSWSASLKTYRSQEQQVRNVKDVMKRGTALYEKFAGFVTDIEAIGTSLRRATESYEDAKSKLTIGPGNLIRQVEMLKRLGIRTGKSVSHSMLDAAGCRGAGADAGCRSRRERRSGVGCNLFIDC